MILGWWHVLHSNQSRCFYDGTSFFDILSASYIHCALENMHCITFVFALYRCRVFFWSITRLWLWSRGKHDVNKTLLTTEVAASICLVAQFSKMTQQIWCNKTWQIPCSNEQIKHTDIQPTPFADIPWCRWKKWVVRWGLGVGGWGSSLDEMQGLTLVAGNMKFGEAFLLFYSHFVFWDHKLVYSCCGDVQC